MRSVILPKGLRRGSIPFALTGEGITLSPFEGMPRVPIPYRTTRYLTARGQATQGMTRLSKGHVGHAS